jgi:hypothetical protein
LQPHVAALAADRLSYHYRVYGLALRSELAIDGLLPRAAPPHIDCEIVRGEVAPLADVLDVSWLEEEGEPGVRVTRGGGAYALAYRDGTRFRVEPRTITASWTTTAADMATYLLGPVLALVLRLRGTLALHASAVVIDGEALLFAGSGGAGKSTTAAAFLHAGASLLTDDVAAIAVRDGGPHVEAGHARVRLWDDSAAGLYGSADALPLLTPTWEKRFVDASQSFGDDAVPLRAIVVLAPRGEATRIRPLRGLDAVIAVLARTSVPALLDDAHRAHELEQIAALVSAVPVFELSARADLQATSDLIAAILAALS